MANIPIRVLLVNNQLVERRGLETLLLGFSDVLITGEARTGAEALKLCTIVQPDVVLMDLSMPDMDGAELTGAIRERHPNIHVIILTRWDEYELVQRALAAGAESYMLKNVMNAKELENEIRVMSPARIQNLGILPETYENLTPREMDVLALIVQGQTNGEIAQQLVLSRTTVKYHVSNILSKMGVDSRTGAAAMAVQYHLTNGSIPSPDG